MPLNKTKLTSDINTLLNEMATIEKKPEKARQKFAKELANIIDAYVKSATITATPINIAAAAMSNSGGPVVAANNLICDIQ